MSKPRSFGVIAYPSRERAEEALAAVEQLASEKHLELLDAAIAVALDDGRLELHQTRERSVGEGAIAGGVAGLLLGLALGVVIGGAVVGMLGGGALGVLDTGIDNDRMKEVGRNLEPGQAALCVLVGTADWGVARDRLTPLGGEVLVAELTPEAKAALERARSENS